MSMHYYPLIIVLFESIFTFLLAPISLSLLMAQFLGADEQERKRYLVMCLGTAPIVIAWGLMLLFKCFSGHSSWLYIAIINIIFIVPLLLYYKQLACISNYLVETMQGIKQDIVESKLLLFTYILASLGIGLMFFLSIYLPYTANDPIEYAVTAKIFYNHHSNNMYPIITGQDYGGFIAPYTHPLAYAGTIAWSYLIQGTAAYFGLARIISPFFALSTFLLIAYSLRKYSKTVAMLAALFYITTPMLLHGFITHQIEAIRLYSFFVFFMFLPDVLLKQSWQANLIAGLLLGACLFCHSLGILAIPIFIVIYFIHAQNISMMKKLLSSLFIIAVGVSCVITRYFINLESFGHLLQDNTAVRALPSLHFAQINAINNYITSPLEKWLNGLLPLFTHLKRFGIAYLMLIFSALLINKAFLKQLWRNKGIVLHSYEEGVISIAILVSLGYVGMIILSVLLNMSDFITNARYMVTAQAFMAIASAWTLVQLCQKYRIKHTQWIISLALLITAILPVKMVLSDIYSANLSFATLNDSDLSKALPNSAIYKLINSYNQRASASSKLLTFVNGQTYYYGRTPYIFRTDKILLPLYLAKTEQQARQVLSDFGINYVIIPPYQQAYITQSMLNQLLADPRYSEVLESASGGTLVKLHKAPLQYKVQQLNIPNSHFNKTTKQHQLQAWYATKPSALMTKSSAGALLIHKPYPAQQTSWLYSGPDAAQTPRAELSEHIALVPWAHYRLLLRLRGTGVISIYYLSNLDTRIKLTRSFTIASIKKFKTIPLQFITKTGVDKTRIIIAFNGPGWIQLKSIVLDKINYKGRNHTLISKQKLAWFNTGWRVYTQKWMPNFHMRLIKAAHAWVKFNLILAHDVIHFHWSMFLRHISCISHYQKFLLSIANTNFYSEFSAWHAVVNQTGDNIFQLRPSDSRLYTIKSTKIRVNANINNVITSTEVEGAGTVNIQAHGIQTNGKDYLIGIAKKISLSNHFKKVSLVIATRNKWLSALGNTKFKQVYLQLTYRRPNHDKKGLLEIKNFNYIGKP